MWVVLTIMIMAGIMVMLILTGIIINYKSILDKEKSSPFECGFDPVAIARLPFCMKFFLIAVVFLVFDIEVALLIPMPLSYSSIQIFLLILVSGLLYEWYYGGLNWMA
uniref:NADH-ubiquinone oxidoreductase chain 3 n=1 Tax=Spadella cephaloptera TaxID=52888 RepID=A0A141CKF1_9BILA|nr:NADH dehydrogenase subunit 3 [Spadella cephaloptera]